MRACEAILDRAWGRMQQRVEVDGKGGFALNVKVAPPAPKELASGALVEMGAQLGELPESTESPAQHLATNGHPW